MEQVVAVLAVVISGFATVALRFVSEYLSSVTNEIWGRAKPKEPYADRVQRLTKTLTDSAGEAESIAREMSDLLQRRTEALTAAEQAVAEMEAKEKDLAARLENLRQVAPDSVKVFEDILDKRMGRSDRSASRYFVWGVICTVIIGIIGLLLAPVVTRWLG